MPGVAGQPGVLAGLAGWMLYLADLFFLAVLGCPAPACPQGTVPRCLLMPRGRPGVHSPGALGRGLSPRGASRRWWFSLGCTLTCPFLPQASACWPRAMRCSLKRSLTALLAASFLLLLLILYGGSRQEQDPLQVSPSPVMSCWRGHWSILHPCLPHKNPNPSSAPFPAPYHPQSPALPSPPPGVALCTWASPIQELGGQDRGSHSFLGPPCSRVSVVLWGLTWLPAAPIQVALRGLAPDAVLQVLQPEGAQRILRDTDDLLALHNVSYHLLAGSLSPHKSEWLRDPRLSRALGLRISPIAAHVPAWACPIAAAARVGRGLLPTFMG